MIWPRRNLLKIGVYSWESFIQSDIFFSYLRFEYILFIPIRPPHDSASIFYREIRVRFNRIFLSNILKASIFSICLQFQFSQTANVTLSAKETYFIWEVDHSVLFKKSEPGDPLIKKCNFKPECTFDDKENSSEFRRQTLRKWFVNDIRTLWKNTFKMIWHRWETRPGYLSLQTCLFYWPNVRFFHRPSYWRLCKWSDQTRTTLLNMTWAITAAIVKRHLYFTQQHSPSFPCVMIPYKMKYQKAMTYSVTDVTIRIRSSIRVRLVRDGNFRSHPTLADVTCLS